MENPSPSPSPSAVFIDTSVGTHLAMIVSDTDTVSDLKKKIKVEHKACFPTLGEIHVNAVKVKRKGDFYHLVDSMHVRSAFNRVKKNWFLSVDASILSVYSEGQNMLNPCSSSQPVLLAITNKQSGDQLDTAPDGQPETVPKRLFTCEVSAAPEAGSYQNGDEAVPAHPSENLGVEQNDGVNCSSINRITPLPSLGMHRNNEISPSNALSTKFLDVCDSLRTGSRNKKGKKKEKKSKACNPEDLGHLSSREAIGNELEMQKESLVFNCEVFIGEPEIIAAPDQSSQSPKSSEPQQASFTEKLVEPLQEKEFGQNEVTGGIEKAIVTGESVAAEELKASPKKRKKSKRLKESDGERINSSVEHVESSLIGRPSADFQKVPEGDESPNKLENGENFLSQARGGEKIVMATAEPLDMHGTKVESSQQVIEKNMNIESTEEKTKKKSKKSRRLPVENLPSLEMKDPNSDGNDPVMMSVTVNETTNKHTSHMPVKALSHASEGNSGGDPTQSTLNVDLPSNDHPDKGENLSEARGGETIVKTAASGLLDLHRGKAEPSQQIIEKEVKSDSIGEKTKKKRKKSRRSTGENLPLVEIKDPNSDTFELTPMNTTLNDTTYEHTSYMTPMKAPSHTSEGNDRGGPAQSINSVDLLSGDHLDKGESNLSQARGGETIVSAATAEPLDVHGTKAPSSQQIIEKELNIDCTEEKTKKRKKKSRRLTGENLPRVEMKDPNSNAFEPTLMSNTLNDSADEHTRYMKAMKDPSHTSEGKDEGGPQSIIKVDLPSGDHLDKGENNMSQARGGETIVRAATVEPFDVHETNAVPSQQIIEKVNFENTEEKKTKKKRKKSGRSTVENQPSVEMKDPKSNTNYPLHIGATVDGTASGHISYMKPMEAPGNNKSEPAQSIVNVDLPSGDHLAKGENNLSQTMGGEIMVRAAVAKPLDAHGTESLKQIVDKEMIIESTEDNTNKKRKKLQRSTVENLPSVVMEDSNSEANDPPPISATVNETHKGHTHFMKTMKAPSRTYEGNNEGDPLQLSRDVDVLPSGDHLDEVINHVKAVNESDIINFNDYFAPRQLQQEALAPDNSVVDGGTKENRAAKKVKSKRRKKANATVDGSSSGLQSSLMSNGPQDGLKSPTGNSYSIQLQESLANDKNERSGSYGKEPPVGPGSTDLTLLSSKSDTYKIVAEEASGAKVIVVTPNLEKDSETSAASGSDMKRTKNVKTGNKRRSGVDRYRLAVRKSSHQHIGEVVDTSERRKSLLATSVAIFKDESSGSSAEAEGLEDSDAGTRTPSDKLLSDYSDGESNANLNSPGDGNLPRKDSGASSMKNSQSSDRKDLTLDRILRSSSRYKKAKLAASQSQLEDSESQPPEFVPDSQANS